MKFCLRSNMKRIIPCSQIGMKEVVRGLHGCKLEVQAGLAPLLNIVCRMRTQSMQLDCRRLSREFWFMPQSSSAT